MAKRVEETVVSEAVSENVRKRGRPRITSQSEDRMAADITNAKTRRGQLNGHYCFRALCILGLEEQYKWLANESAMEVGGVPKAWRPTILSELGRIEDWDELRAIADEICKLKPDTKSAVVLIRRWRLGKAKRGETDQLSNEVIRAINSYLARYPQTSYEQIRRALTMVGIAVTETFRQ